MANNNHAPYNRGRQNNLIMPRVPRDRAEFNRARSQPIYKMYAGINGIRTGDTPVSITARTFLASAPHALAPPSFDWTFLRDFRRTRARIARFARK